MYVMLKAESIEGSVRFGAAELLTLLLLTSKLESAVLTWMID